VHLGHAHDDTTSTGSCGERSTFEAGAELVILDLRQIEFMDSTGLRVVLSAHQRAHETGRRFALVRGADQVERVLTVTGSATS
jgi:anti-anti-sigma factor